MCSEDLILLTSLKETLRKNEEEKGKEKTKVVNIKFSTFDVYIGRGSMWGNPFSFSPSSHDVEYVKDREEAIESYKKYILSRPDLLKQLEQLRGKILGCHCKPLACHGDVLVEILEEKEEKENAKIL